jgi:hypothetical protein
LPAVAIDLLAKIAGPADQRDKHHGQFEIGAGARGITGQDPKSAGIGVHLRTNGDKCEQSRNSPLAFAGSRARDPASRRARSSGGPVGWPLAARAQQSAMPVIGFMSSRTPEDSVHLLEAFRRGFKEGGFAEGQNVAIEFCWARGDYNKLPELAADLVSRRVNVLTAVGGDLSPRAGVLRDLLNRPERFD